jgi:hypothetical protein
MAHWKVSDVLRDLLARFLFELAFTWIRARSWAHSEVAAWRRALGWALFIGTMARAVKR